MNSINIKSIAVGTLIVGLLVIGVGLLMAFNDPDKPMCDGEEMSPGDRCISSSESQSGSYEELVLRDEESTASDRKWGSVVICAGGILVIGSVSALVIGRTLATGARQAEPEI
jgi:hypothetical protein